MFLSVFVLCLCYASPFPCQSNFSLYQIQKWIGRYANNFIFSKSNIFQCSLPNNSFSNWIPAKYESFSFIKVCSRNKLLNKLSLELHGLLWQMLSLLISFAVISGSLAVPRGKLDGPYCHMCEARLFYFYFFGYPEICWSHDSPVCSPWVTFK